MSHNRLIKHIVAQNQYAYQLSRTLEDPFYQSFFENSIRKPIIEGIEQPLQNYLNPANRNSLVGSFIQTPRDLELRFLQEVPHIVWTGEQIKGQGNCSIQVALYDVATDRHITSGPEASANLEIEIIDVNDLMVEDFNQNIIGDKKGRNLLKGDVSIRLRNGIVSIDSLHIVHRRDWIKVKRMRLIAKCVDSWEGIKVKAAKTEPFTVKDKRLIEKCEEPRLTDKVSRLKNIGKAAKRSLEAKSILTVKDFLTHYNLNPEKVKETLGCSDRKWIEIVDHARKCKVERKYLYRRHSDEMIVFSEVYDVVGMVHGGNYFVHSQLSETKKEEAKKIAKEVFENKMELVLWSEPFPPVPLMEPEGPSQKNADSCPNAEYEVNVYKPEGLTVMDNNCCEIDRMELDPAWFEY